MYFSVCFYSYLLLSGIRVMQWLVLVKKTIIFYCLDKMNENLNVSFEIHEIYVEVFLVQLNVQLIHYFLRILKSIHTIKKLNNKK